MYSPHFFYFPASVHITKKAEKDGSKGAFEALKICSYQSKGTVESWQGGDRGEMVKVGCGLGPLSPPVPFSACRELLLRAGGTPLISDKVYCTEMHIPVGLLRLSSNKYF